MKWDARVSALERLAVEVIDFNDREAEFRVAADRRLDEMRALVPEPLRQSVTETMKTGGPLGESLREWLDAPFAAGSPTPASDFRFPVALVEFLLRPPRNYWVGHACESCGLMVPVFLTWSNDPDPPPVLKAFPTCPACGGVTGYS